MRTQGEHDAKVRFWLSRSSAEKTDSQINELENDLIIVAQGQMKIKKNSSLWWSVCLFSVDMSKHLILHGHTEFLSKPDTYYFIRIMWLCTGVWCSLFCIPKVGIRRGILVFAKLWNTLEKLKYSPSIWGSFLFFLKSGNNCRNW